MSKMKNRLEEIVSVCKLLPAYAKALVALARAVCNRRRTHGYYDVDFIKVGKKWYCKVPGFPQKLFEHTMMVGGAAKLIEYYSQGDTEVRAHIKVAKAYEEKYYCGMALVRTSATLTGGAFYTSNADVSHEELWLCPVTLFLLGRYPERIFIYRMHKSRLSCPIFFE